MIIYLAGIVDPAFPWREDVEQAFKALDLSYVCIDPARDLGPYVTKPLSGQKQCVVNLDFMAVRKADIVFAYLCQGHFPIGTICELKEAREHDKLVFLVYDKSLSFLDRHPWIPYLASYIRPVEVSKPAQAVNWTHQIIQKLAPLLRR